MLVMEMNLQNSCQEIKEVKVVIPTVNRYNKITSLKFFPDAILFVRDNQKDKYKKFNNHIETIKGENLNFRKTINAIMDRFEGDDIFIIDDDILKVMTFTGENYVSRAFENPYEVKQLLLETANLSNWCGFNQFSYLNAQQHHFVSDRAKRFPFSIDGRQSGGLGILKKGLRFDESINYGADYDHAFRSYKKFGGIFCDKRIAFINSPTSNKNPGGVSLTDYERVIAQRELKIRWGSHLRLMKRSNAIPIIEIRS